MISRLHPMIADGIIILSLVLSLISLTVSVLGAINSSRKIGAIQRYVDRQTKSVKNTGKEQVNLLLQIRQMLWDYHRSVNNKKKPSTGEKMLP